MSAPVPYIGASLSFREQPFALADLPLSQTSGRIAAPICRPGTANRDFDLSQTLSRRTAAPPDGATSHMALTASGVIARFDTLPPLKPAGENFA